MGGGRIGGMDGGMEGGREGGREGCGRRAGVQTGGWESAERPGTWKVTPYLCMSAAMFLADTLGSLPASSAATAFCSSASAQARPASESASLALMWRRPYAFARRAARADLPAHVII